MNVMAKTKKVVSPRRDQLLAPEANFLVRRLSPENAAIETRPQFTIGLHDARVECMPARLQIYTASALLAG